MPDWNIDLCQSIATRTLEVIGEKRGRLSLIRMGENCIFDVIDCPYILRVHRKSKKADELHHEIEVTNFLYKSGFSCNVISDVVNQQPILVDGFYVTIWEKIVHNQSSEVNWKEFGALVREFHEKVSGYEGQLGEYDPFTKINQRILAVRKLSKANETYLGQLTNLSQELEVDFAKNLKGSTGVIHGDAHPGNVLVSKERQYLIDYENVSKGHQYWDIIPLCVSVKRMGKPEECLNLFVSGYGVEIRGWEHFDLAVKIRELYMTMWLYQNVDNNPRVEKEISIRMEGLVGNDKTTLWTAF